MLADFTGMGRATIARAEQGEPISPQSRQRLCDYLGKSAEQLGLVIEEQPSAKRGDGDALITDQLLTRRGALRGIGIGAAVALGLPGVFASRTVHLDATTLDNLEQLARGYWQLRASMRSADLLPGVIGHLDMMTNLAQQGQSGSSQSRLVSMIGGLALVAGQLAFDTTDISSARHFYRLGARAAEETHDTHMRAIAFALQGLTFVEEGYPDQALALLNAAERDATPSESRQIRAWIAAITAECYAALAIADDSERALDRAKMHRIGSQSTADSYWSGFTESRLLGYQSACAVRLNQPEKAVSAIQASLDTIIVGDDRRRLRLLVDLAHAHAAMNQIDEACAVATNALEGCIETDNRVVQARLHAFRATLEPWHKQPSVRAFTEQLLLA
jgi:hypothetical protein